jgi:hypothetical protein
MKKTLILAMLLLALPLAACGSEEAPADETTEPDLTALPADLDFPAQADLGTAGVLLFAPERSSVDDAVASGTSGTVFTWFMRDLVSAGTNGSVVMELFGEETIPNALLVTVEPGASAEVGDLVLCEGSSGAMTRAIVTAEGTTPTVKTLDFFNDEITLEADSFTVLTGSWEAGMPVAVAGDFGTDLGTLIKVSGSKALVLGFGGSLESVAKSSLTQLPLSVEVAVGDTIYAPVINTFEEVTVTAVDLENGTIEGEYEFAGSMSSDTFFVGEVSVDEL